VCLHRVVKGLKLSKEELGQELLPEVRGRAMLMPEEDSLN
jgi:hypothetical protein